MTRAPKPKHAPQRFCHHGRERTDDHGWLRDADWQRVIEDPGRLNAGIRAHLTEENRRAEAFLAESEELRQTLFAEMKARIRERDTSAPLPHGPWLYYSRQVKGGEHPLFCRRPSRDGTAAKAQLLLDGNREARGCAYFRIGCAQHSPDHRHLAWSCDVSGGEEHLLRIRALDKKDAEDLPEQMPKTDGSCVWSKDGQYLFYVRLDALHRPRFVHRHRLGTDVADDDLIFEEHDPRFFVAIHGFGGGEYVGISSFDHSSSEQYLLHAQRPGASPQLLRQREANTEYDLHFDGARQRWLIRSNIDSVQEFQILEAAEADIGAAEKWRVWLPHNPQRYIEDMLCLQSHILLLCWENALPHIHVLDPEGREIRRLRFTEPAYELALIEGHEHPPRQARIFHSSMKSPGKWFDYDPVDDKRHVCKRATPRGGFSARAYRSRRLHVRAEDGASVPVSLLYHRDTPIDGSTPLLLYGYGAYGISTPAGFSLPRLSLAQRGFICAIAHVRGGRERGQGWYLDGKLENKPHGFSDFVAVAQALIERGYTSADGIHAWGGSAGGLLVGAALNRAPHLFRSVVAEVPFVDVLATMLDESLPLTPVEWLEWGNPIEKREEYDRIAAYSPVDGVRPQDYPFVLATAGVSDPRVGYWEPAKWIAKLRENSTSGRAVLLRTEMDAGHGGGAGRYKRLREIAFLYAFVMQTARWKPPPPGRGENSPPHGNENR